MYCKYDSETKKCLEVGTSTDTEFYKSIGMTDKEVEKAYDGSYYLKGYAPTQNIDELKASKLSELTTITSKFDNQLVNTDMIIKSSLGFSINADLRSQNNLRGLISVGAEPVNFVTADNSEKVLNIKQLNTLLNECALNSQSLYLQKWKYKAQIENAQTKEELKKIEFKFTMKDFGQENTK